MLLLLVADETFIDMLLTFYQYTHIVLRIAIESNGSIVVIEAIVMSFLRND